MVAAAALAATVVAAPQAGAESAAVAATSRLGVYPGNAGVSGVQQFSAFEHQKVRWVLSYLPGNSGWAPIDNPSWYAQQWSGKGVRVVFSVPILEAAGQTLAAGAAGDYNSHFASMGRVLVANGQGSAVLRLGWEFGGSYMPWSAASDPVAYAAYWRQIVDTLRAVPGQHFQFDWNGGGGSAWNVTDAYPGDAYVDYVTADIYDQSWDPAAGYANNTASPAGHARAWQDYVDEPYGLAWLAEFASAHHKGVAFPEWGVIRRPDGHGGGDDPYFIQMMHAWMVDHDATYEMYYDDNTSVGDTEIQDGTFPASAAVFKADFGSLFRPVGDWRGVVVPPTS